MIDWTYFIHIIYFNKCQALKNLQFIENQYLQNFIKAEKYLKMYSNEFRPYYILIKKEEEKGDRFARINMEVKHRASPEPINPFTKKTAYTQTYPTKLIPAAPRRACCYNCT